MSKLNDLLNEVAFLIKEAKRKEPHNYNLVINNGKIELVRPAKFEKSMTFITTILNHDIKAGLLSTKWNHIQEVLAQLIQEGKV